MGTMIQLALGRLEVDWGKNSFFKDHGVLFQEADIKPIPTYLPGDDWPNGEPLVELNKGFGKPLQEVVDRLELLGFTVPAVERHYDQLHQLHELDEQPVPFEVLRRALNEVDVNRVSGNYGDDYDPGEFVRKEIVDRLCLHMDSDIMGLRLDHWEVDLLLENFSPYGGLRLLAENPANLPLDVTWDFMPLVEAGWATREEFHAGPSSEQCFLVVTEGSSDAKIIKHALHMLKPHIADFFRFVDMEEGYPFSGTGNLFKFTQGLASIGILNNTVIVYDNDAEGVAKLEATGRISLPANLRTMLLPKLQDFSDFPTVGPTGRANADINGKAAAIECYLDLKQPGLPEPVVRWTSFNNSLSVYQGELEHKSQYMKHFLGLSNLFAKYETRRLEAIVEALMKECIAIAEHKNMELLPK